MKRRTRKIFLIVLVVSLTVLSLAGAEASGRALEEPALLLKKADQCRKSLYSSKEKKRLRHYWLNCIHRYEKIYTAFPKSDHAVWALYKSAGLFTNLYVYSGRSGDLDEAIRLYRRVVDEYKDHRLADDAQYLIGDIYYRYRDDPTQAYVEFLKVDIKYPSGDMRPRAKKALDKLVAVISKKDAEKDTKDANGSKSELVPVKEIRHWSTPNYTRVVVDLERAVKYEHHLLKADRDGKIPRRLYLDLKNALVTSQIESPVPIRDGLLQRARAAQYQADVVRVVLDIESIRVYKVFHLYDPFRIVVDVRKSDGADTAPASRKESTKKDITRSKAPDSKVSLARQLGLNIKRIVIDPGHGGKDPGCYLRGGVMEKDIVLAIAKKLAKRIEREIGCEVFLTRTEDIFLSLEQRTAIANMKKADLFISLHINAHKNRKISGLETYFLNIATDEGAVMVAARENATSQKNISDLQKILNDLMLNTKIHESNNLAHEIQRGMVSRVREMYSRARDLGVKQAPFYVLIGAEMPAILVETGFLTNRYEMKRLASKPYQESLAAGICVGIRSYIESISQVFQGG
jgi:N-acetylmuramoyl-L-alanine amidase